MKTFKHEGKTYRKTNRLAVEKSLDAGKEVKGFMVPNKVNQFHWFAGWHLASTFCHTKKEEWVRRWNASLFYLEPELGSGYAVWVEKE